MTRRRSLLALVGSIVACCCCRLRVPVPRPPRPPDNRNFQQLPQKPANQHAAAKEVATENPTSDD